ncbi:MAG: hypothetical protein WBP65_03205 [Candidatus Sulfotelmatobacter sp.]|jgi:hypothetical protein
MKDAQEISALVDRGLAGIRDPRLVQRIRDLLVTPYPVERMGDYGSAGERFTCWTVLEHRLSNTGIAFCSQGFDPANPWGLVALSGPHMSIGMDSAWFVSLEDAMRESAAWNNPVGQEVQ